MVQILEVIAERRRSPRGPCGMSIHEDGGHRDFFARNGWSSNARLLKGARFIDVFFLGHFYFTLW